MHCTKSGIKISLLRDTILYQPGEVYFRELYFSESALFPRFMVFPISVCQLYLHDMIIVQAFFCLGPYHQTGVSPCCVGRIVLNLNFLRPAICRNCARPSRHISALHDVCKVQIYFPNQLNWLAAVHPCYT